jgi:UDPglucose--hexose-1-phosphate uridylyltransferase
MPDTPGWRVRVVPNKYPALSTESPYQDNRPTSGLDGIHGRISGFGSHEILIETPVKNRQMADMDVGEISEILEVCRERMQSYSNDRRFRTVVVFKNHGREAGASLVHSHTQLLALPVIPERVATQLRSFQEFRDAEGVCLLCSILNREMEEEKRVVSRGNGYLVMAPFAAISPFQLNIIPLRHEHDFSSAGEDSLHSLAQVLLKTLRRLRSVLGEHPWNMILHNAPVGQAEDADVSAYHWFIEITPRLSNPAGFEMGSGYFINTLAPEEYAEILGTQDAGRGTQ